MEFTNPYLLWSFIGVIIPIVIHLINRASPKRVTIPTVKFISLAVEKTHTASKVSNLLQLLMRLLLLIVITLILSRPFFTDISKNSSQLKEVVLIVDNSFYTNHNFNHRSQFEEMVAKSTEILEQLPQNISVSVISAQGVEIKSSPIRQYVQQRMSTLQPVHSYIDIHRSIELAASILADFDKDEAEIYLVSDMNKGSWQEQYEFPSIKHKIHLVNLRQRKGNHYIYKVEKSKAASLPQELRLKVGVASDTDLYGLKVQLLIEGQLIEEKHIAESLQLSTVIFDYRFNETGISQGEIRLITDDALHDDNLFYFSYRVSAPPRIYVFENNQTTSTYLKAALAPRVINGGSAYEVQSFNYGIEVDFDQAEILVMAGELSFTSEQWQKLKQFIFTGGKVIFMPDAATNIDSFAGHLSGYFLKGFGVKTNLLGISKRDTTSIFSDREKSFLNELVLTKAIVFPSFENDGISKVHLRFGEETPLIVSKDFGTGEIFFISINCNSRDSNFTQIDTFPLFWHALIVEVLDIKDQPLSMDCGGRVQLTVPEAALADFEVVQPTLNIDKFTKNDFAMNDGYFHLDYSETFNAGHYRLPTIPNLAFSCNNARQVKYFITPELNEYEHLLSLPNDKAKVFSFNGFFDKRLLAQFLFVIAVGLFVIETFTGNKRFYAKY